MKRNFFHAAVAVFLVVHDSSSFANSIRIIYGLDNATHFSSSTSKDVYIQAGSFMEKSKAWQFQRDLNARTRQSVRVLTKGALYTVLVGPFHSSVDVRKTAMRLQRFMPVKTQANVGSSMAYPVAPVSPALNSTANWFIGVGGGEQFPISSDNMLVNNNSGFPAPYDQDSYSMNAGNGGVIGLSAGRRWARDSLWFPSSSVGMSWQYFFNTNVNGTVMQYSDPEFVNYNYSWNVKSNMLLASAKLNLVQYWKLSPYINGGVGGSFNSTSGYSETALADVTPRDNPAFGSNSSTQFAYQAGAGVDFQVSPQVILSAGYNYQNLGSLSSGPGAGTWSNRSLGSGSFGSNELLISVNYLFQEGCKA